jgi:CRISPR-associated protein Cmr4
MKNALLYVHALSPLHAGTGQTVDVIDLPIARERSTNLPMVPGSSIKGVLRDEARARWSEPAAVRSAFGPEDNPSEFAGAVTFGDLRLLLFPVASVTTLFAWVTSPYLVRRYLRDRQDAGVTLGEADRKAAALVPAGPDKAFISHPDLRAGGKVYLDDADLDAKHEEALTAFASSLGRRFLDDEWQAHLTARLVLVSDAQLGVFTRQATEVVARVRLKDDEKTVERGGLWYEEALPAETILYGSVIAENSRGGGVAFTAQDYLDRLGPLRSAQLGGKATVGRGLCRLTWEPPIEAQGHRKAGR